MTFTAVSPAQMRSRNAAPTPPTPAGTAPAIYSGAMALVCSLEALAVAAVFGLPAGVLRPVYDLLAESATITTVPACHDQGAGHSATGYAQATGLPGVCITGPGPGATNLITALADANMDSVPLVAIMTQTTRALGDTQTCHDIDVMGMTRSISKHNILVCSAADIPTALAEAFHVATSGRPGPVVVALTTDALTGRAPFHWPPQLHLPGYAPPRTISINDINAAVDELRAAHAPVLYVGGGVIKANAVAALRELAELTGIPVVTTLMALGAFPDDHPQHYGMPGMHGTVAAVAALQKSDLVIAVGARFDDRVTGAATSFAPHARVVHIDIDDAEIGKNRHAHVGIVGHARTALRALTRALRPHAAQQALPGLSRWRDSLDHLRTTYPLSYRDPDDGTLAPERVIEAIGHHADPTAIFTSGVGQHQMWAANFITFRSPRTWLNSGGLGTMGYAVPAALGAQIGQPNREVWAIDGDGCFQMTYRELAVAVAEKLPLKVAVINNGNLGMVKQLQSVHYDKRYSSVQLATAERHIPNFVALAEALGCAGLRCTRREDLDSTISAARAISDRPVVIDFVVHDEALVWPMIAAGAGNDDIAIADGIRPLHEGVD